MVVARVTVMTGPQIEDTREGEEVGGVGLVTMDMVTRETEETVVAMETEGATVETKVSLPKLPVCTP